MTTSLSGPTRVAILTASLAALYSSRGSTPSTKVAEEDHRSKQELKRNQRGRQKGTKHFITTPDGRRVPAFTSKPGRATIWPNISEHHPDKQPQNVNRFLTGRDVMDYHITKKAERLAKAISTSTFGLPSLVVRGPRGPVTITLQNKAY